MTQSTEGANALPRNPADDIRPPRITENRHVNRLLNPPATIPVSKNIVNKIIQVNF